MFITSNNEKELPDAFLRRCFFHYIKFPDADTMKSIVDVHFPDAEERTAGRGDEDVLRRAQPARPEEEALAPANCSTGSSCWWPKTFRSKRCKATTSKVAVPPLVGALLKNEQDVTLFEKLVFMQRNNR